MALELELSLNNITIQYSGWAIVVRLIITHDGPKTMHPPLFTHHILVLIAMSPRGVEITLRSLVTKPNINFVLQFCFIYRQFRSRVSTMFKQP